MKTIDLTTAASALAYLCSLPADTSISLPGACEPLPDPGPGDAVAKITGQSANQWAASMNRWEWTASELVTALEADTGTITIPLPADARNHTDARCPQCGGMLRNASAGGTPGEVACLTCDWTARWLRTTGALAGQDGPSQAVFEVNK
jgi:hypothetical protein